MVSLSRSLAASYTEPGWRGAGPALCSGPLVPDSPVVHDKLGQATGRGAVMPARLLPKPPRRGPSAPSFLPGPGPRPALHALCHLLPPRQPRRQTAAWVIPGTWAQAGAHTPGTGGLFAPGPHLRLPPARTQSPASCIRVPRPLARPEQAQGCARLLSGRRPGVQAPLRVPCPSPQETTVARASALHRLSQRPGSCREGPAPTGQVLAAGVPGRRRARESDALEMAAWRGSYSCPDPPSTVVTASQTTRQARRPRALQPART